MPSCDSVEDTDGPVQLVGPCAGTEQGLVDMHGGRGLQTLGELGEEVDDSLGVVVG